MELSMKDTFPACVDVLQENLRPLGYRELTEKMLNKLGIKKTAVRFEKEIENVREKLLLARQRGTFYAAKPLCMGALQYWFNTDQLQFNLDVVRIPGSAQAGASGAFEVLMRAKDMQIHNQRLAHTELLNRQRASGLVIEKHVSQWFAEKYPEFYLPPDNEGHWEQWCNHDFKLKIGEHVFLIDVAGPDKNGQYGKRGKKPKTDLHLVCRITGKDCLWEGAVRGERFGQIVIPETITSPSAVLVWLNCQRHGIPYSTLSRCASHNLMTAA